MGCSNSRHLHRLYHKPYKPNNLYAPCRPHNAHVYHSCGGIGTCDWHASFQGFLHPAVWDFSHCVITTHT